MKKCRDEPSNKFNSDITYCTCYECSLECDRHPKYIPEGQNQASFADLYQICRPYIRKCVDEVMKTK